MDDFAFLHCFRSRCYLHIRFLNSANFFVSEIILIRRNFFVFVSPAVHMLSTGRRRHDVLVMFGDVIYDVRNAHWRVNNKIKRKFTLFQWTPKTFSSRVMKTFTFSLVLRTRENTDVFITLDENIFGIHSKSVNILYLFITCNMPNCPK